MLSPHGEEARSKLKYIQIERSITMQSATSATPWQRLGTISNLSVANCWCSTEEWALVDDYGLTPLADPPGKSQRH